MKRLSGLCCFLALSIMAFAQNPKLDLTVIPDFFKTPIDGNISQPRGVAVNSKGHIFIFNTGHYQLMEFDGKGHFVKAWGEGLFQDPHGLRIDKEDNIWTTDLSTHLILKFSPEGKLLIVLGEKGTSGLRNETRGTPLFNRPADIAFASNGDIYVADGYGNHRIVKLDKYGNWIKSWGEKGKETGNFDNPHNVVVDQSGKVYVADRNNLRVQIFSPEGAFIRAWTNVGKPWGLAITHDNYIYLSEGDAEKIFKLDLEGNILGEYIAGAGHQPGQLIGAHGIAVGLFEELYVTGAFNWKVNKYIQNQKSGDWHRIIPETAAHHRHESALAEIDGKIYAFGGRNTNTMDIYDPTTNTWTAGAETPLEMHHFQAITYKGEIWVIGAFTGPYPKEEPIPFLYVYNPKTDKWRVGGKLPEGRYRGSAGVAVYKDKFYLLCGNQLGHFTGHNTWFDEFDPATGQWKNLPDAPHTRDHFQVAIIDGKLYAAGGRNTSALTNHVLDQTIPEVDVYDFATGKWKSLPSGANIPTLRAGTTSLVKGDQLIVMGGESGTQIPAHSEVEAYDVSDGKWIKMKPMLVGRHGTQAVMLNGKVYIAGGASNRGGGPELNVLDCWEVGK